MLSYLKQEQGFYRNTAKLTIPIVLQNIITSTLAMADTFMVGLLGEAQMAALTLANIPVFVLMLFLFGVQSGSSILISQYWGKQDTESVQRVLGLSWWLSLSTSGVVALLLFFFPHEFLQLFGNDPEVVSLAAGYGKWIGFSYFCNGFTLMYAAAYRSMGKPQLGMYLLGVSMALNLFLNWVFIYGNLGAPRLEVTGAAVATVIARGVEAMLTLCHILFNKNLRLSLSLILLPQKEMFRRFVVVASPVVLNETLWGMGTSVFATVMGHMEGSAEILAAYAIATNIERLVMVIGFGIGGSSAILIGNAIGAGANKEKVWRMGLCLATLSTAVGFVSGLFLLVITYTLLPQVIAPMFLLSDQATHIAQIMSTFLALLMAMRTFNTVVVVGIFRGGGDTKKSTFVDLMPLWLVAIPLTVLCGTVWKLPIFWVVFAMKSEDFVKSLVGFLFLRKDTWVRDITAPK